MEEKPAPWSISLVLPFYNEEAVVKRVLDDACELLQRCCSSYEIIAVDDGSEDATAEHLRAYARHCPYLQRVHHAHNRGYGAALRSGFERASLPWIFYSDGDGQFEVSQLAQHLPRCGSRTLLSGYRLARSDSPRRKLYACVWNALARSFFRLPYRDINCAFKLFPRSLVTQPALKSEGAMIATELLWRAHRAGYSVVQVGVQHRPRRTGVPTGGNPRVIYRALRELYAIKRSYAVGDGVPSKGAADAGG